MQRLRDYQEDLIDRVKAAYKQGYKSPCIVLPCGGGKSVIVAEIAKRLNLDSLKFTKLETIIETIGLPKCKVCTHCFDGSSAHTI